MSGTKINGHRAAPIFQDTVAHIVLSNGLLNTSNWLLMYEDPAP